MPISARSRMGAHVPAVDSVQVVVVTLMWKVLRYCCVLDRAEVWWVVRC